ncbi:MAG: FAD-dependent oxidoreductase [Candidatus Micrarchaeota archaeon]
MTQTSLYDMIIIGGGVSGFSAAMYSGRLKMKTLVLTTIRGGTIINTNEIANWPGIKMVDGMTLAKNVEEHALEYGTDVEDATATKIEKKAEKFIVHTDDGKKYEGKTIIFATGTEWKKLGVKGEKEFSGRGVHYCALCDGYFYADKEIGIVGGADSAVKEAILLTQWAKKVYIIYRKDKVRPEPVTLEKMEQMVKQGKIEVINNANIVEVKGKELVTSVVLDRDYKGSEEFKLDGIFVAIGHIAQSQLAKEIGITLNEKGEIVINKDSETNVSGAYAAGDVTNSSFKQAITGAAEGVLAAVSAYKHLENKK